MSLEGLPCNVLVMTRGLIANLLGLRREGVTGAAGNVQEAGLITGRRGRLTVIDRSGLQASVCAWHAVVRKELARLLPGAMRR